MCGEKGSSQDGHERQPGSPPRVRGKVPCPRIYVSIYRITPACAGKRQALVVALFGAWDHPRVCGEKLISINPGDKLIGSPPRVRGKVAAAICSGLYFGITPACAGKRLKKAHKIKDFDPVPIRFHLVFRRFERWCSNLPTPDGNVPV